jgi:hypothetical protein
MITQTLFYNTYAEFYNQAPVSNRYLIGQQMEELHLNCFNEYWDANSLMGFVVDISFEQSTPEIIQINGYLSLIRNKYNPSVVEIYNVCVHPSKRRTGVLKRLFDVLDPSVYYLLAVEFFNKQAYYAYTKYFFCDFVAIGKLSHMDRATFVLGGHKSIPCSEDAKNNIRALLDKVSTEVLDIQIQHVYNSMIVNINEYKFLSLTYKEFEKILPLDTTGNFVRISDTISHILNDSACLYALRYPDIITLVEKFAEKFV